MLLITAVTSQDPAAFTWGAERVQQKWGPIWKKSELFDFTETSYYEKSMGTGLKKQFWAFDRLIDPSGLPATKVFSNDLETEYGSSTDLDVERPINIDPGYLTEAKLVLATTKDRDHRLYLAEGIYAEVTIYFHRGEWKSRPWTYPDYQRADFHQFFTSCRNELRRRYRDAASVELTDQDFQ